MASIFKQQYTAKDENGKKVKKKSQYWYIDYKATGGTRKRVKGFKDKTATAQLAAKLEKEAELADAGIIDRFKEHRKRPLLEHLEDFRASLLAKGNTTEYVQQTVNRIKAVFNGCKFVFWNDISANIIQKYLASLRNMESGISTKTSNYYLQGIKHFCRFMIQDQRASESPVEHLSKVAVKSMGKIRRSLETDEIRLLLEVTEQEPKRFNATGHQRVMLYRIAAESGLRANELRSLTASSFDLKKCTVTTKAEDSKNGKESILPLRKETAAIMQSFLAGKMPHTKAFAMPSKYKMADMLRADCKAAGIECEDKGQGKLDFHALRHTFGSMLAASGVHPKTAQELMRHSDINLTMSRYSHTLRGQTAKAVASLPDFTLPSRQNQKATGTDDSPVDSAYKPAYKKLAKNAYFDK
ncbi:site-specific integrase, partial [Candidatus Pacearchaeota archaeon]|nr:site-specific integrase [Candidatus Pacearchaeota archaeon]